MIKTVLITLLYFFTSTLDVYDYHEKFANKTWVCLSSVTYGDAFIIEEKNTAIVYEKTYDQVGKIKVVDKRGSIEKTSILKYESTHRYRFEGMSYVTYIESFKVIDVIDSIGFFDEETVSLLSDKSIETRIHIDKISAKQYRGIYEDGSVQECIVEENMVDAF